YRPALRDIPLAAPFTKEMGINPELPRQTFHTPPIEVVLDCLTAWDKAWKSRGPEAIAMRETVCAPKPRALTPVSMKKLSHLTPTIQCVRPARPSTVAIRDANTKKVMGSGVVVDPRGYLVTNNHVVSVKKTVAVSFVDSVDKIYKGEVVRADPNQDLAIVRILDAGKVRAIEYDDSEDLEIGQSVIVIG